MNVNNHILYVLLRPLIKAGGFQPTVPCVEAGPPVTRDEVISAAKASNENIITQ